MPSGICRLGSPGSLNARGDGFDGVNIGSQIFAVGAGLGIFRGTFARSRLFGRFAQVVVSAVAAVEVHEADIGETAGQEISLRPEPAGAYDDVICEIDVLKACLLYTSPSPRDCS